MHPACPLADYAETLPGPSQWSRRHRKPQSSDQILNALEWKPTICVPKNDPHDPRLSSTNTSDFLGTQITDLIHNARGRSRYMPSSQCHNSIMHANQNLLFQNLQRFKRVLRLWILKAVNVRLAREGDGLQSHTPGWRTSCMKHKVPSQTYRPRIKPRGHKCCSLFQENQLKHS